MAYTAGALHLGPAAPGELCYSYDAGADTMATVSAAGYFTNAIAGGTGGLNLVAEDRIYCQCADGNLFLEVVSISATTGAVTTQYAGGDLPINTAATGTDATLSAAVVAGFYEIGSSISTASRYVLPTPYRSAAVKFLKVDSGTSTFEIDAGGSGATAITFDGSNRRAILRAECDQFHVVASGTSRWRIQSHLFSASAVSEGGSVRMPGT